MMTVNPSVTLMAPHLTVAQAVTPASPGPLPPVYQGSLHRGLGHQVGDTGQGW